MSVPFWAIDFDLHFHGTVHLPLPWLRWIVQNAAFSRTAGALRWSSCWLKEKNCANSRMADEAGRPPSTSGASQLNICWTLASYHGSKKIMTLIDIMKWHLRLSEFSYGLEARKQKSMAPGWLRVLLKFWAMLIHFPLKTVTLREWLATLAHRNCHCDKSLALKSSVEVRRGMQGAVKDPWPEMIAMPATLTFYEEVCQSSQQPSCRLQIRKHHARQPATSNPSHEMRFWWGVSSIIWRGHTSYSIRSGTLRCLVSWWWYNCYICMIDVTCTVGCMPIY